jgi:hypothetical protein
MKESNTFDIHRKSYNPRFILPKSFLIRMIEKDQVRLEILELANYLRCHKNTIVPEFSKPIKLHPLACEHLH